MGLFKKIFKGVKKVFKGVGKIIKKVTKPIAKLVNKLGVFGQIGMFVLSMHAGPILFSKMSSFIGNSALGKFLGAQFGKLGPLKKMIMSGVSRISNAASGLKSLTIDNIGSIAKGAFGLLKQTTQAGLERLGVRFANPILQRAGGEGLRKSLTVLGNNVTDDIANNIWDAGQKSQGFFKGAKQIQAEIGKELGVEYGGDAFDLAKPQIGDQDFSSIIDPATPNQVLTKPDPSLLTSPDLELPLTDINYGKLRTGIEASTVAGDATSSMLAPPESTIASDILGDPDKFDVGKSLSQKPFRMDDPSAQAFAAKPPTAPFSSKKFFDEVGGQTTGTYIAQALTGGVGAQDVGLEREYGDPVLIPTRGREQFDEIANIAFMQGGIGASVPDYSGGAIRPWEATAASQFLENNYMQPYAF